jgi:hypothetical protein
MSQCSKPACSGQSSVVLAYDYSARKVLLLDLNAGQLSPHVYGICDPCAERLTPPRGWYVEDLRTGPSIYFEEEQASLPHSNDGVPLGTSIT